MDDFDAAVQKITASAFEAGVGAGLIEAHKLLACRQMHDAADALLTHWDSIKRRADATRVAHEAITKAAKEQA